MAAVDCLNQTDRGSSHAALMIIKVIAVARFSSETMQENGCPAAKLSQSLIRRWLF